jgi:hypothetical protein
MSEHLTTSVSNSVIRFADYSEYFLSEYLTIPVLKTLITHLRNSLVERCL